MDAMTTTEMVSRQLVAVEAHCKAGNAIVLDAVDSNLTSYRRSVLSALLRDGRFSVVMGDFAELLAVATSLDLIEADGERRFIKDSKFNFKCSVPPMDPVMKPDDEHERFARVQLVRAVASRVGIVVWFAENFIFLSNGWQQRAVQSKDFGRSLSSIRPVFGSVVAGFVAAAHGAQAKESHTAGAVACAALDMFALAMRRFRVDPFYCLSDLIIQEDMDCRRQDVERFCAGLGTFPEWMMKLIEEMTCPRLWLPS